MSVINKHKQSMMAAYQEYVHLCQKMGKNPEPSVNFEDAGDVRDLVASMLGEDLPFRSGNESETEGRGVA